jgi:hypothetical protein
VDSLRRTFDACCPHTVRNVRLVPARATEPRAMFMASMYQTMLPALQTLVDR